MKKESCANKSNVDELIGENADELDLWRKEAHTEAKHRILAGYLKAWFPILGSSNRKIIYLDGFAGPGEYEGGEDGSPIIALKIGSTHALLERSLKNTEIIFYFLIKTKFTVKI